MLTLVNEESTTPSGSSLLAAALEAEVNVYIAELADERDDKGHRLVVRNGYHQLRNVTTAAGAVEVKAPRVNDKRVDEATGERKRFSSAILPPWCRKSPKISEVLPLLYLHGLSSGDFVPALEQFLREFSRGHPSLHARLPRGGLLAGYLRSHRATAEGAGRVRPRDTDDRPRVGTSGLSPPPRQRLLALAHLARPGGTEEASARTDGGALPAWKAGRVRSPPGRQAASTFPSLSTRHIAPVRTAGSCWSGRRETVPHPSRLGPEIETRPDPQDRTGRPPGPTRGGQTGCFPGRGVAGRIREPCGSSCPFAGASQVARGGTAPWCAAGGSSLSARARITKAIGKRVSEGKVRYHT